ncbi:LysR family transcriptional regulator [Litoreibacter roseus]|nr:LysR family transcriptional regulator [Litoreibacter roseus]
MDQLNDHSVFAAVTEAGGFSSAARRLGITASGASKSVGRLEARLGVRLFTRTTRKVSLTEEGQQFYARVRAILDDISEAEAEIQNTRADLRGRVRIDMPAMLGQGVVMGHLLDFKRTHPGVDLDIRFNDHISDLVEQGIDLAFRIGELPDTSLHARKVMDTTWLTCAAPGYLDRHGPPERPADLGDHSCASYIFKGSGRAFQWRFTINDRPVRFEPPQHLCVNDGNAYLAVARSGLAIVQDLDFNLTADLKGGTLVEVMQTFKSAGPPVSIVYPDGRHLPRRVRAVFDHLVTRMLL